MVVYLMMEEHINEIIYSGLRDSRSFEFLFLKILRMWRNENVRDSEIPSLRVCGTRIIGCKKRFSSPPSDLCRSLKRVCCNSWRVLVQLKKISLHSKHKRFKIVALLAKTDSSADVNLFQPDTNLNWLHLLNNSSIKVCSHIRKYKLQSLRIEQSK